MENQKRAYFIGSLAFCVAVAVIVWFACAGRSTVHDLRNGANAVRTELDNAAESQRAEADTLRQASEAVDRSKGAIEDSKRTNQEISNIERNDAEIIRESQSILERVREKDRTENKN